ncbi:hypothetical protein [Nocardia rhizosphaerihabitans]|uniref:hypothetical protein n=1 Tax=Nocardia rhizosphaerihabitans TaxID=1691570 RepID=UPI001E499D3B|nr:hypothetical protein [Nocardia rhizosphaerihabitans]
MLSLMSCARPESAMTPLRFDRAPISCAVALAPARAEIDQFADGLQSDRDRISTDPDPDLFENSSGVRCAAIFRGGSNAWDPLDDQTQRPTSRHLFVSIAVILPDDSYPDPETRAHSLFDRRRPHDATQVEGIGDAAYSVSTHSRYPGGIEGTIAASVEIRFRISNLIVDVDAGGINVHDSNEPAELPTDLARDAEAIATALASNIDAVMT